MCFHSRSRSPAYASTSKTPPPTATSSFRTRREKRNPPRSSKRACSRLNGVKSVQCKGAVRLSSRRQVSRRRTLSLRSRPQSLIVLPPSFLPPYPSPCHLCTAVLSPPLLCFFFLPLRSRLPPRAHGWTRHDRGDGLWLRCHSTEQDEVVVREDGQGVELIEGAEREAADDDAIVPPCSGERG